MVNSDLTPSASYDPKDLVGTWTLVSVVTERDGRKFDSYGSNAKGMLVFDANTHIITGGTGKYKGITGSEPFTCISMPALAGPGGYFAMDIPHNTTWEIK